MPLSHPFFREVGSGPGVVCLHANASTSSQWRGLMDSLAPRFHVLAADSFGAGRSPAWPSDRQVSLRDEVELLQPVFDRAGERFTLVAHSYGAAIALIAALFGFGVIASGAASVAKILFFIFIVLFIITLITGRSPRKTGL